MVFVAIIYLYDTKALHVFLWKSFTCMTLRLWVVSVVIIYEYDTKPKCFLWQSSTRITLRLSMVSVAVIYVCENKSVPRSSKLELQVELKI